MRKLTGALLITGLLLTPSAASATTGATFTTKPRISHGQAVHVSKAFASKVDSTNPIIRCNGTRCKVSQDISTGQWHGYRLTYWLHTWRTGNHLHATSYLFALVVTIKI